MSGDAGRAGGDPAANTSQARTVVHLMRHGEVANPGKVLYGRLPGFHLSELGVAMADLVAGHLAGHDIAYVVASPLERAQQTARPIAELHGRSIATDPRLIEADNFFEGKTVGVGEGILAHPEYWPKLVNPFRPSWGEPYRQVAARMMAAIETARQNARGHEAVAVSHQLPVWTARQYLEGHRLWHDPRRRECALASLTSLTYRGDELESVTYSEPAAALLPQASKTPGA